MVKYETFNLWYMGSNPIGLKVNGRPFVFQTICVDSNSAGRKVKTNYYIGIKKKFFLL